MDIFLRLFQHRLPCVGTFGSKMHVSLCPSYSCIFEAAEEPQTGATFRGPEVTSAPVLDGSDALILKS